METEGEIFRVRVKTEVVCGGKLGWTGKAVEKVGEDGEIKGCGLERKGCGLE